MPPTAANEIGGDELGPLHTVPQAAFPQNPAEGLRPPAPLLRSYEMNVMVASIV